MLDISFNVGEGLDRGATTFRHASGAGDPRAAGLRIMTVHRRQTDAALRPGNGLR
jgi:hypothetical protein